jgi:Fe-S cluster biogenesis protein NfuA
MSTDPAEARRLAARIDTLMSEVQTSAPPAVTERVEDLVRALVGLYGAGIERTVELVGERPGGRRILRELADDELVGSLLVLHDLHPDDVTVRVQAALDKVRPYLGSHAGGVTFTGVDDQGVVHLRLEGSCDGCPSSAMTVQNAIEDAILAAAPDVLAVEVEGVVSDEPALLQIQPYAGPREGGARGWVHVDVDVPPGTVSLADVAGEPLLVAALGGLPGEGPSRGLVAYRPGCPRCGADLSRGRLAADLLTCADCAAAFDLRLAGRSADDGPAHLVPVPLLPDGSGWRVSLGEPVAS